LMLLLLFGEAIDSLPTKNFVELRSNDVGTTAGERGLIPGKVSFLIYLFNFIYNCVPHKLKSDS